MGDGAAAFLIFILGALAVGGALALELTIHPPYWLHLVLWPPLLIGLTILGLRAGKGMLLLQEYRHDARQDVES